MPVDIGLFTEIPSKFFGSGTAAKLGPTASLVFLALCEHANRHERNTFKASDKAIAADTGYSPRTICDARKRLVEYKLVTCERPEGQSFEYTIPAFALKWKPMAQRLRPKRKPRALHASTGSIP